jgi:membrane protein YqaA with SNARE-associated domain
MELIGKERMEELFGDEILACEQKELLTQWVKHVRAFKEEAIYQKARVIEEYGLFLGKPFELASPNDLKTFLGNKNVKAESIKIYRAYITSFYQYIKRHTNFPINVFNSCVFGIQKKTKSSKLNTAHLINKLAQPYVSMESFIYETTNHRIQRGIALTIVVLSIVAIIIVVIINLLAAVHTSTEHWYTPYIPDLVHNITPIRLFIICIIGGMIFFPISGELAFFFSIEQGYSLGWCMAAVVTGFFLANIINYLLGLKLHKQIMYLLSAKKFFGLRRQVNRWGVYVILLLNSFPAPSDMLTFCLGTIRYNYKRLFILIVIGNTIKLTIIAVAAHSLHGLLIKLL